MRRDDDQPAGDLDGVRRRRPRVTFAVDGDLEDVPVRAAEALTPLARALISHGDVHHGRSATMRIIRTSDTLLLQWEDPECSTECSDELGALMIPQTVAAGPVSARPAGGRDSAGGICLEWAVAAAAPTGPLQRGAPQRQFSQ